MNKKLKIGLFGFASLAIAGVAGGVTAGILVNQNHTTSNANRVSSSIHNDAKTSTYSLQAKFNKQEQKLNITVENGSSQDGVFKLLEFRKN